MNILDPGVSIQEGEGEGECKVPIKVHFVNFLHIFNMLLI